MLQEENKQDTGIVELNEAVKFEFSYKIRKPWNSMIFDSVRFIETTQ